MREFVQIRFPANRRHLHVQRTSSAPILGADTYSRVCQPVHVGGQRVPALRFDHPVKQALLAALIVCHLLPTGFANRDLQGFLAPLSHPCPACTFRTVDKFRTCD